MDNIISEITATMNDQWEQCYDEAVRNCGCLQRWEWEPQPQDAEWVAEKLDVEIDKAWDGYSDWAWCAHVTSPWPVLPQTTARFLSS